MGESLTAAFVLIKYLDTVMLTADKVITLKMLHINTWGDCVCVLMSCLPELATKDEHEHPRQPRWLKYRIRDAKRIAATVLN